MNPKVNNTAISTNSGPFKIDSYILAQNAAIVILKVKVNTTRAIQILCKFPETSSLQNMANSVMKLMVMQIHENAVNSPPPGWMSRCLNVRLK